MKVFICFIIFALFIVFYALPYKGKCLRVFERWGREERVRLLYIDTPELAQGLVGELAKKVLAQRIEGREIELRERDSDIYGRTLAVIYLGEENINFDMLVKGYAFPYRFQKFKNQRSKREHILAFERAKWQKLGIFRYSEVMEPYSFRKMLKKKHSVKEGN